MFLNLVMFSCVVRNLPLYLIPLCWKDSGEVWNAGNLYLPICNLLLCGSHHLSVTIHPGTKLWHCIL